MEFTAESEQAEAYRALGERLTTDARSKVIATIGPGSEDRIEELVEAGMSVARINFSHSSPDEHRRRVQRVREVSDRLKVPVAVLGDIQGPKMRLGRFVGSKLRVEPGDRFRLVEGGDVAARGEIQFDVEGFLAAVAPGHRVFLADGAVEMVVEARGRDALIAGVRRGGNLGDKKGFHLPDSELSIELPTPKDIDDLELSIELDVDFIGLSFVGAAEDIRRVRALAPGVPIVAKIERLAALQEIRGILEEADGIMVARGDLGVEVELERLPIVQKTLIRQAREAGVFSITATEMLESMVSSSRPTRAEVADVANAILDGTDAVMLSAETAVGRHPVEAVRVMSRVASSVERSEQFLELPAVTFRDSEPTFSNAMALAAVRVADALQLGRIVCFTETGNTVRQISRYRPSAEILAVTPSVKTWRQMAMLAHVRPFLMDSRRELQAMIRQACDELMARRVLVRGEEVVFVAGVPAGRSRSTNLLKLHRVGEDVQL